MRHHATDPQHFLWHTHQFPDLHAHGGARAGAARDAAPAAGPQAGVFQCAGALCARRCCGALGIADLFDDVFAIEHTGYRPKPDSYGFLRLFRTPPPARRRCVMVEDTLENLQTAKRLGMKTVWVAARRERAPGYVDFSDSQPCCNCRGCAWQLN